MPTENSPAALAAEIDRQHRQRLPFQTMTDDLDLAYRAQEHLVRLRLARGDGPIAGWKAGLTTRRMQEFCGVDQPIAGPMLSRGFKTSPAALRASDFVRLGIECELALRVGANGVDQICAAFEIIEDRAADYARLSAAAIVADGAWNAGAVLGPAVAAEGFASLIGFEGVLTINGAPSDRGRSEDAGGDPRLILDWLRGAIGARGHSLAPGQWVLTGSIIPSRFPRPGDVLSFSLGDLPPVELSVN